MFSPRQVCIVWKASKLVGITQKPETLLRAAGSGYTDDSSRVKTHSFPEDIAGL